MKKRIPVPTSLQLLARTQGGAFTRPQVLAHGGTQAVIDRRLDTGEWVRLGQGVYTASQRPGFRTRCWAGLLLADGPACVGGLAAAHLYGIVDEPSSITIWGDRSRTQGPWRFRRGDRTGVGELSRLRIDDAVLDACAESHGDDVVEVLASALRNRLTTPERLRSRALELETLRHRRVIIGLLPDLGAGIESTLENYFLHKVIRPHGLPEGVRQISVSDGTRSDVVFDDFTAIIELDGRRGHEGEEKWRDARRDNQHLLLGYVTLRFGWHDVVLRSCVVASVVGALLRTRGWGGSEGRPVGRCGRRCTVENLPAVSPMQAG